MSVLLRHHVVVSGPPEATALVFAHGFGCDQSMWRLVAPAFEDRYRVVLFDHVGCGSADSADYDPAAYSSLTRYAEDVLAICRELELRDVVVVGHSVSAMVAVLAQIEAPELIAGLVLLGPSARYIDDGDYAGGFTRSDIDDLLELLDSNHLGWQAPLAGMVMAGTEQPELTAELEESFCRTDPDIARQFAEVTFLGDNREDLERVSVPTLVVQSASDVIAPVSAGEFVREHIPGAQFALIDTVGHCPHLSAPSETIEVIEAFLGSRR